MSDEGVAHLGHRNRSGRAGGTRRARLVPAGDDFSVETETSVTMSGAGGQSTVLGVDVMVVLRPGARVSGRLEFGSHEPLQATNHTDNTITF